MNQKKSKQLRRDMKAMGFHAGEVAYKEGHAPVFLPHTLNKEGKPIYDPMGTLILKVKKGVPRTLAPCGRKLYQDMKQAIRAGEAV